MINIKRLLDEAGLEYEVDEDGDYQLVMNLADDDEDEDEARTQVVVIGAEAQEAGCAEFIHIYSKAADIDDVPEEDLLELLKENSEYSCGAWEIADDNLLFNCKVLANKMSSEELLDIISIAARTADEKETEYSDEDIN
ncbi:MAG: hypothetical protein ACI37J_00710 [Candidatus Bruticola sp.]